MKCADLALYRAKAEGRGTFRFFEPDMDARIQARRALEVDLRRALQAGEFTLAYQPQVNLLSNDLAAMEALLRWNHPERGPVSPAEFIPVAEEMGLIVPLGEWVLREACNEAARWPDPIRVAVNLSPVQFRNRGLVTTVTSALAAARLAPSRLELEITEAVLLQDDEAIVTMLHQLRALGVRIAMDDFGTGYSSLSYLRSFPFDKIKIDRSFIKDIERNRDSAVIIRAVASLGASLGIETTAEGVETAEQLEIVRRAGCTEMQGYLVSPPRPACEVARPDRAVQARGRGGLISALATPLVPHRGDALLDLRLAFALWNAAQELQSRVLLHGAHRNPVALQVFERVLGVVELAVVDVGQDVGVRPLVLRIVDDLVERERNGDAGVLRACLPLAADG